MFKISKSIMLVWMLFLFFDGFSQISEECTFEISAAQFRVYRNQAPSLMSLAQSHLTNSVEEIPVKFTVLMEDDGQGGSVGNVTQAWLDAAIDHLNQEFPAANMFHFYECCPATFIHNSHLQQFGNISSEFAYLSTGQKSNMLK